MAPKKKEPDTERVYKGVYKARTPAVSPPAASALCRLSLQRKYLIRNTQRYVPAALCRATGRGARGSGAFTVPIEGLDSSALCRIAGCGAHGFGTSTTKCTLATSTSLSRLAAPTT